MQTRTSAASPAALEPDGEKRGDGGCSSLVGVGGPGVKRDRRDLEGDSEDDQHHSREKERVAREASPGRLGSDGKEVGRPGDSVGEPDAVKEERRREGTQQEILDGRLDRGGLLSRDTDEDVRAKRHELETQVEDHEIQGGRGEKHSRRRQQKQRVELAGTDAVRVDVSYGKQSDDRESGGEENIEECE